MPFWNPGSLTEEESWRVTAYLLRQNNLWNASTELSAANAADVKIPRAAFLTPVVTAQQAEAAAQTESGEMIWWIVGGVVVLLILLMFILKKSRNTTTI
jgi:flagellar biosynthesis/type III secretory pathway M-ring protein FliF/YscJ